MFFISGPSGPIIDRVCIDTVRWSMYRYYTISRVWYCNTIDTCIEFLSNRYCNVGGKWIGGKRMTLYSLRIYMVFCMDFRLNRLEESRFCKIRFLRVTFVLHEKISSFFVSVSRTRLTAAVNFYCCTPFTACSRICVLVRTAVCLIWQIASENITSKCHGKCTSI